MGSALPQFVANVPEEYGFIPRPRLNQTLQSVLKTKLILVSAPSGYGKTTAVAEYIRYASLSAAWHEVTRSERDISMLHQRTLNAWESVIPGIQKGCQWRAGATPTELATALMNFVRIHPVKDFVAVFDDVHQLDGVPSAEAWLLALVEAAPPNCHLIFISRTLPNLPFAQMVVRREILPLGQEVLRFSPDEIRYAAYNAFGTLLPMDEVKALEERLEGWPVGTMLALHPIASDVERSLLDGEDTPEGKFNKLAETVLGMQLPNVRDFLLASSTLRHLTPEACTKVLQLFNSADYLNDIYQRNLFLSRTSQGLTYHRLFRDFLQSHFERENADRFRELHRRAGEWFEEQQREDEAFEHYFGAQLLEEAAEVAESVAQIYFKQGRSEILLDWNRRLTLSGIDAPHLHYMCAAIYNDRTDYEAAVTELNKAETLYRQREDVEKLALVELRRARIQLQQGNYVAAAAQAAQLLTLPFDPENLRGYALRVLGISCLRLGDAAAAIDHLEQAVTYHRAYGDQYALSQCLQDLEFAYLRVGSLDQAAICLQEVVMLRRAIGSASALALALNNLGYHHYQCGDYAQARATFQEGLVIVAPTSNRYVEAYLLWSMGDLERDCGRFTEAKRLYTQAFELTDTREPPLRCGILLSLCTLYRWLGEYPTAQMFAEQAQVLAEMHHLATECALAQALLLTLKAQTGDQVGVLSGLDSIINDLQKHDTLFELIVIYTLRMRIALLGNNLVEAAISLTAAYSYAEICGVIQSLAAEAVHDKRLLAFIAERSAPSLFTDTYDQLHKAQALTLSLLPSTTISLRVITLGDEHIECDGEHVLSSEWRSSSAREMFYYLLFVGATTREQLSLIFWPDQSTQRVRSNFHTTLYRVRQAVGENVVIYQDEVYGINPDLHIWCDVFEFEALIQKARLLSPRHARTEDLWRKALELYQDDFLSSMEQDWITPRRESLRELFLDALLGLSECVGARTAYQEAIFVLQRALAVDSYREDIHRAMMRSYARMGERRKLISHFEMLQGLLDEELGVEPSTETVSLFNALLS